MDLNSDKPLKVLYLEDSPKDAELVRELLCGELEALEFTWVASKAEFLAAIKSLKYDIILSDYRLPDFNGLEALQYAKEICPLTPFICVSGTLGDVGAVELLTSGAVDYIIKDRVQRLPKAVLRAMEESRIKLEYLKSVEEIKQLNLDLEKRVLERTAQLEFVNKELETFAYSVSHDLRAPLRTIEGFSTILGEDFGACLPPEAHGHLDRIKQGVERMHSLINGLLRLSKVVREELSFSRVDMAALAKQVYDDIADEETKKRFVFTVSSLPSIEGDAVLLYQVWSNLISNAIKYTKPAVNPRISIACTVAQDSITYFIKDNGVGFDMKFADRLFGVFSRLHSDEEFEGLGIGLANVKRIITRHSGTIWAESILNEGAIFSFKLNTKKE